MLLGTPVMIALVRDRGDDGGLAVAPAVAGDAGALADRRPRAVGGDQEPRRYRTAIGEFDVDATRCRVGASLPVKRSDERNRRPHRPQRHPFLLRLLDQRGEQRPVLDHVRERLARLRTCCVARPRRRRSETSAAPHPASRLSVTTMSRIGCASATFCQTPMVSNSRRAAAAIAEARASFAGARRARVRDRDRERRPQAPGAARSPAPGRQSRRRRSAHRYAAHPATSPTSVAPTVIIARLPARDRPHRLRRRMRVER